MSGYSAGAGGPAVSGNAVGAVWPGVVAMADVAFAAPADEGSVSAAVADGV